MTRKKVSTPHVLNLCRFFTPRNFSALSKNSVTAISMPTKTKRSSQAAWWIHAIIRGLPSSTTRHVFRKTPSLAPIATAVRSKVVSDFTMMAKVAVSNSKPLHASVMHCQVLTQHSFSFRSLQIVSLFYLNLISNKQCFNRDTHKYIFIQKKNKQTNCNRYGQSFIRSRRLVYGLWFMVYAIYLWKSI